VATCCGSFLLPDVAANKPAPVRRKTWINPPSLALLMERSKKRPGDGPPGPNSDDAGSLGAYGRRNQLVFDTRSRAVH
jgi:hypothetical protein